MKNRNYGIDILKIISMFFILILHIDTQGGLFNTVETGSKEYAVILILEIISICAVNVYGIISGYLSYSKYENKPDNSYNFKRLIYLWFQVVFYSFIISLMFVVFGDASLTKKDLLLIFLPVANRYLWYFTAYFLLFFFMPIINSFVKNTGKKTLIVILISILVVYSLYQSFFLELGDFTFTNRGYNVWWLMILFLIGATIKKTNMFENKSTCKLIVMLLIAYFITYLYKILISVCNSSFILKFENFLFQYISPSYVVIAILWVTIFRRININSKLKLLIKFLPMLSAATFGVYVIHLHPYIWQYIDGSFVFILNYNIALEPLFVIVFAFIGLIIMLLIDIIRSKLFKLLKVDDFCKKIDEVIRLVLNYIVCFLNRS